MKKPARLLFLTLPVFLSLFAGMLADSMTRYIINLLPWTDRNNLGLPILIVGLVFLAVGITLILRLIGISLDSFQTGTKLIIASILSGLGTGWIWSGFVLISKFL